MTIVIMTERLRRSKFFRDRHCDQHAANGDEIVLDIPDHINIKILNDIMNQESTMFTENDEDFSDILVIVRWFQFDNVVLKLHYHLTLREYDPVYDIIPKAITLDGSMCVEDNIIVRIPPKTFSIECHGKGISNFTGSENAKHMNFDDTNLNGRVLLYASVKTFSCVNCGEISFFTRYQFNHLRAVFMRPGDDDLCMSIVIESMLHKHADRRPLIGSSDLDSFNPLISQMLQLGRFSPCKRLAVKWLHSDRA